MRAFKIERDFNSRDLKDSACLIHKAQNTIQTSAFRFPKLNQEIPNIQLHMRVQSQHHGDFTNNDSPPLAGTRKEIMHNWLNEI